MKKLLFSVALFISGLGAFGQKHFTLKEAMLGKTDPKNRIFVRDSLSPENMNGLQWIRGTNTISWYERVFDKDVPDSFAWILVISDSKKTKRFEVNRMDIANGIGSYFATMSPTERPPKNPKNVPLNIVWRDGINFSFVLDSGFYVYNIRRKTINRENVISKHIKGFYDINYHTGDIVFTKENNLWMKTTSDSAFPITRDGREGIVYGQSVHRDEFGIHKGIFWSESGDKFAFYRMDESMVTQYNVYRMGGYPNASTPLRYPMAGAASHHVTIGVFDMHTKRYVYLKTGEPADQYLTNITWSPDEKYVYVATLNRGQDIMILKKFDAKTGEHVEDILTERSDTYVEPMNGPLFVSKSGDFIWQSQKDGFNHLYHYDEHGQLIKQLTAGQWLVAEVFGIDKKKGLIYFSSTKSSPLDLTVHSVNIKTGEIKDLGNTKGFNIASFNSTMEYFISNSSSANNPRTIEVYTAEGAKEATLLQAENPLKEYQLGEVSIFTIKAADGATDLYCRMIKPVNFDATKKYPVVTYLYGGPHAQMVKNNWLSGADRWMHYMAQNGYVVFTMDNRGSEHRGKAFESATFQKLGTEELKDQVKAVEWLKSQSFVDANRMGVFGWSFGGFMTTGLMTRHPGSYQVGVAGGPVIDWRMYEIMYTERYMNTPSENEKGYNDASLLNYVDNLTGKLLLIHGVADDVVLIQHSLEFLKKCVDKGKQVDYFVYPDHPHNVRGKDRLHLYQKVTDYFNLHLKP